MFSQQRYWMYLTTSIVPNIQTWLVSKLAFKILHLDYLISIVCRNQMDHLLIPPETAGLPSCSMSTRSPRFEFVILLECVLNNVTRFLRNEALRFTSSDLRSESFPFILIFFLMVWCTSDRRFAHRIKLRPKRTRNFASVSVGCNQLFIVQM